MDFTQLYDMLSRGFDSAAPYTEFPELSICISRVGFHSHAAGVLPGAKQYRCPQHNIDFPGECTSEHLFDSPGHSAVDTSDTEIDCNRNFNYIIVNDTGDRTSDGVIILFHGLNEKKWDKYLPWAYKLLKNTGKPVILFPLAFHMDRTPDEWSASHHMNQIAHARARDFAGNSSTSFVNAAISSRLHSHPERIFWTGLQSYIDVSELLSMIRQGKVARIAAGSSVDLFGYSIGAFFSLILMMSGIEGLPAASRLFAFCGGATLDRMYPVSKYILDSAASEAINRFYSEQVTGGFSSSSRLAHYMSAQHEKESYFNSMLQYNHKRELRESRLSELKDRIRAIALVNDDVVPPSEVLRTLNGSEGLIDIKVDVEDFPYPYTHVTPFRLQNKYSEEVNTAFVRIMDKASDFLG